MDDSKLRISIADVDADGPFSIFSMVERHIVILGGTLCLRFDAFDRVISAGCLEGRADAVRVGAAA